MLPGVFILRRNDLLMHINARVCYAVPLCCFVVLGLSFGINKVVQQGIRHRPLDLSGLMLGFFRNASRRFHGVYNVVWTEPPGINTSAPGAGQGTCCLKSITVLDKTDMSQT